MLYTTEQIKLKLGSLCEQAARLQGAFGTYTRREAELASAVGDAKARHGLSEEIVTAFEALQTRAHERSVGAFERLLSAILHDVLPDEGVVKLALAVKNNTPWLDVQLDKGGHREDIYEGNGGGIDNVVSTGMRFAALSRTNNRRLLVLDEPDHWLKPAIVPAFVKVLAEVAQATDTQTFYISHFPPEYFEGQFNLIRMSLGADGFPEAELLQPTVSRWTSDDEPGIRCIELYNIRRHKHTVLSIPPGPTALIGDNNLGKSTAIITALRAVGYGESDDTIIRHGEDEARIVLHLEKGRRVAWSRKIGRSPVVLFELYEGDKLLEQGRPGKRNESPHWVVEELGIRRVDDLDIQLLSQKSKTFLLSETASKRAQILSVGRESGHLKALMKAHEETKGADRDTVRSGEAELTRLRYRLRAMPALVAATTALQEFRFEFAESQDVLSKSEGLEKAIAAIAKCEGRAASLKLRVSELPALGMTPELPGIEAIERLLRGLEAATKRSIALAAVPVIGAVPELPDSQDILRVGKALGISLKRLAAFDKLPASLAAIPDLKDATALVRLIADLDKQTSRVALAVKDSIAAESDCAALKREGAELLAQTDGSCPLCGHAVTESVFAEDVHTGEHSHA